MRSAVTALVLLLLPAFSWAQTAPAGARPADTVTGTVQGPGFTITLPPGVEMDVNPTADIAFGINLAEAARGREWDGVPPRYIGFNTLWNSGATSLEDAVQQMTGNLANLVPAEIAGHGLLRLASVFPAKLGDLPARRLVVEFTNRQKKPSLRQILVAYRTRRDANAVVYVASLTTTQTDFSHDIDIFGKLLAGFKLTPME